MEYLFKDENNNKYVLGDANNAKSHYVGIEQAEFDTLLHTIQNPALTNEQVRFNELTWQQTKLSNVNQCIFNYESDMKIPDIYSELRITNYTESDYYALLGDRKLLSEYVTQEDFPECGRPTLSGLV